MLGLILQHSLKLIKQFENLSDVGGQQAMDLGVSKNSQIIQ